MALNAANGLAKSDATMKVRFFAAFFVFND